MFKYKTHLKFRGSNEQTQLTNDRALAASTTRLSSTGRPSGHLQLLHCKVVQRQAEVSEQAVRAHPESIY
jgi:hypothetical protein